MDRKKLQLEHTVSSRGFNFFYFKDANGQKCRLSNSSWVTPAIWLGVSTNQEGKEVEEVMHLTVDRVEGILPLLHYFVENGRLPYPEERVANSDRIIPAQEDPDDAAAEAVLDMLKEYLGDISAAITVARDRVIQRNKELQAEVDANIPQLGPSLGEE